MSDDCAAWMRDNLGLEVGASGGVGESAMNVASGGPAAAFLAGVPGRVWDRSQMDAGATLSTLANAVEDAAETFAAEHPVAAAAAVVAGVALAPLTLSAVVAVGGGIALTTGAAAGIGALTEVVEEADEIGDAAKRLVPEGIEDAKRELRGGAAAGGGAVQEVGGVGDEVSDG